MRNRKQKLLLVLVAVLLGTGAANAGALYHELCTTEVQGVSDTSLKHGWVRYDGTNAVSVGTLSFAANGGNAWDGGPLNSNPWNTTVFGTGYMYCFASSNAATFLSTSEYSFEIASHTNLVFSMRHTSSREEYLRAAIQVAGDWYVSDAVTLEANAGWAADKLWIVQATNTTWYALDFTPGSTMTIGSSTTLPTTGLVNGFGYYSDAQAIGQSLRYDNFYLYSEDSTLSAEGLELCYQELWSNGAGGDLYFSVSPYGWRQYALHGGIEWKGIDDDCAVTSALEGHEIPAGGSTNSAPLYVDGTVGYIYSYAWQSVSREQIFFQDEYTMAVKDLPRMFFRWQYNNQYTFQKYRALIAVAPTTLFPGWGIDDVDWYATEVLHITAVANGWRYTGDLDLGSASWYNVNVTEGSEISIGSATNAPTAGYIVGSGIYVENKTGTHRFDNFSILLTPLNPPPAIDIAVEYLGADSLALTWAATNGYDYTLWESSDLITGAWSTNQFDIPGEAGGITVTTAVDAVQAYYKVTGQ